MAKRRDWRETADRYLIGRNLGDMYALRPVPIPRRHFPAEQERFISGSSAVASLFDCGPKPWPDAVHAAVAVLRGYFCQEMGGGPYMGYEGEVPTYLIGLHDHGGKVWIIGILCFHYYGRENLPFGDGHRFMFAWVHPFFRRKRLMEGCVKLVTADLGVLCCETPISRGMREVLRKINHPQADDMRDIEFHGGRYD